MEASQRVGVFSGIVVLLGLLTGLYGVVDYSLSSKFHLTQGGRTQRATNAPASQTTSQGAPDVSTPVVQRIASGVQKVTGLNELVVLPSNQGGGVTVSAMVDLGNHSAPRSVWLPKVQSDVQAYFTGVYQSGEWVENAQLYFTQNGIVVAGAGLGKMAFQKLSSEVSTGQSGFVRALSAQSFVTNQGPQDSWFETQMTSNAP